MASEERTAKLLQEMPVADPDELRRLLPDEKWSKLMESMRISKELKSQPIEEALSKSQLGSSVSGFKDWTPSAPTTQEQIGSYYNKLAQEAAKEDVVKDINIGKYRALADAEKRMARNAALQKMLGKGASLAGKVAAPIGAIMGLYGDEISPEGDQFEMLKKLRK